MAYRLLIVPGENAALRALPEHLADDVETMVLDSANDALWEVRSAPPEAIVADLHLPGMSGLDLAEILPNFGVPTKVVLWSRSPDPDAAQHANTVGVHRFLTGDLAADELREALYDALGRGTGPVAVPEPVASPPTPSTPPRVVVSEPVPTRSAAATPEAPSKPAASPSADEPMRKPPTRRRDGPLVLTTADITPIKKRLSDLAQDLGSDCILLTDRSGMPLVEVGSSVGLPMMILGPLLSTSFSTAGELSRQLREEEATTLYMHEGARYDLYCFDISQRFLMVIVFDKNTSGSRTKIGSVWVYAKRAIRDLQEALG